jgi:hypothetical protein
LVNSLISKYPSSFLLHSFFIPSSFLLHSFFST